MPPPARILSGQRGAPIEIRTGAIGTETRTRLGDGNRGTETGTQLVLMKPEQKDEQKDTEQKDTHCAARSPGRAGLEQPRAMVIFDDGPVKRS
jgi:hypothetical protein